MRRPQLSLLALLLLSWHGRADAAVRPACAGPMQPPGPPKPPGPPHGFSSMPSLSVLVSASDPYKGLPSRQPNVFGQWKMMGYSDVSPSVLALLPTTDVVAMVEFVQPELRPNGKYLRADNLGIWDIGLNKYKRIPGVHDNIACGAYVTMSNDTFVAYGGHTGSAGHPCGLQEINVMTRTKWGGWNLTNVGDMKLPRWYPTAAVLEDNSLFVFSGTYTTVPSLGRCTPQPSAEIFNPSTQRSRLVAMPSLLANDNLGCYPPLTLLPSGHLLVLGFNVFAIITQGNRVVARLPPLPIANLAIIYPYTGAPVLLPSPIRYPSTDVNLDLVIFGGQYYRPLPGPMTPASNKALRIRITLRTKSPAAFPNDYSYKIGAWEVEDMPSPRVMADAVVLPTGQVVVINGGRTGFADQARKSNHPVTTPWLYTPWARKGQRFTQLAETTIPRLYHAVATLTQRGDVWVGGCTNCNSTGLFVDKATRVSFSPYGLMEYRLERFTPPNNFADRPAITNWPSKVTYMAWYSISFYLPKRSSVTGMVLYRPGTVTHSLTMGRHMCQLELSTAGQKPGRLLFKMPPYPTWSPRGSHMLYLVTSNGVYSKGVWVNVQ